MPPEAIETVLAEPDVADRKPSDREAESSKPVGEPSQAARPATRRSDPANRSDRASGSVVMFVSCERGVSGRLPACSAPVGSHLCGRAFGSRTTSERVEAPGFANPADGRACPCRERVAVELDP
jgi:hypothetical protein